MAFPNFLSLMNKRKINSSSEAGDLTNGGLQNSFNLIQTQPWVLHCGIRFLHRYQRFDTQESFNISLCIDDFKTNQKIFGSWDKRPAFKNLPLRLLTPVHMAVSLITVEFSCEICNEIFLGPKPMADFLIYSDDFIVSSFRCDGMKQTGQ